MSQLDTAKNQVSADQIYFDLVVSNFQSTTTEPPVFYFNENRSIPFLYNPEEYYLSILRFTIETGSLPVFIPSIKPSTPAAPQTNRDLTIYSLTLEWTDPVSGNLFTSGERFVNFVPQDKSAIPPPPPSQTANGLQNNSTGYYNIYNYSAITAEIDLTFRTAFNILRATSLAGGGAFPTIYAPFLNWDTTSDTAILYGDVAGYAANYVPPFTPPAPQPPHNPIKIYWNAPLFGLFPTFPCKYLGYSPTSAGKNFLFEPFNVGSVDLDTIVPANTDTGLPTAPQYRAVKVYQDSSTTANFSPITALVFTSNTLPINPNQVSTPLVFNNAQQIVLGGNNADFANIITDLVSDTGQYKPNVVYNPTAEYRLITLYGNRPLYNIDLQVYWRTKTGQLIPYRINSGEAITMKIAFLKKSAYKGKGGVEDK
jgi:hypothetical protein